ncbi:30S ribosomal protein S13 [Candidatus Woesearchaeota archaeon]|nr:MAG: 30S ribosomal protein S13 [Candidatus Woesearchaeota archaeon]
MAEFKHIVRIANTDLKGEKPLQMALQRIKGVGFNLAVALAHAAGIPRTKRAGELSEAEEKRLSEVVLNPEKHGLPVWLLNRRKDPESGEDKHLLMGDIAYTLEQDKKREMKMRSYKGIRYQANLPVRGQRTRSNYRPNKGKVTIKKRVTVVRK